TATTALTPPQASTTSSHHPPSATRTSTSSHAPSRTSLIQPRPPQSDKTPIESRQDSDEEEEDEDDGGEAEGQGEGEGEFKGSDEVQGGSKDTSRGTSGESSPEKENMDHSSKTSRNKRGRTLSDLDSRNDGAAFGDTAVGVGGSASKTRAKRSRVTATPQADTPCSSQIRRSPTTPQHSTSSQASASLNHVSPAPSPSRALPSRSQQSDSSVQYPTPSVSYLARPRSAGGKFVGKPGGPGDARYKPTAGKKTEKLAAEAAKITGGATGRGGRRRK
ncbi:hypothetical protein JCM5353_003910, partial [Sporobolomyces roseus]